MKTRRVQIVYGAFLLLATLLLVRPAISQYDEWEHWPQQPERLTRKQVAAVILAVEDEIYDYSQERFYNRRGVLPVNATGTGITLGLYITPHLGVDGIGRVIYLDMPGGEVMRDFEISPEGLIYLEGNPQLGFPITQSSHYTSMEDHSLTRDLKAHWLRAEFTLQFAPSRKRVLEAAGRQLTRTGWSEFLEKIDPQHYIIT